MTIYEGITIFLVILGFVFIGYSLLLGKTEEDSGNSLELEDYEEYQSRVEEINQKLLQLNEYSEFTKSELDAKHKELLFLYQLISEKSKALEGFKDSKVEASFIRNDNMIKSASEAVSVGSDVRQENHNKQIIDLSKQGYSPAEIAKMLDIGQGQVKLVLDLYR